MRWRAAALGTGAFCAGAFATAIALAPATLVDAQLSAASGGRLRLAQAQGSVWAGAGWIEVRDAHGTAGVAKRLAWRVLPWRLLRGELVAEANLGGAARPFPVTVSFTRVAIARAAFELPAAALAHAIPELAALGLSGELQVDIPSLSLGRERMQGGATLRWRAAASSLVAVAPLGDYEVRLSADGPAVHAALSTLAGPLALEGKGSWSADAEPSYLATARVPAPLQEELAPLLRLIAVERGAGRFEISSGRTASGS
jgi:general secretion pathway protein N